MAPHAGYVALNVSSPNTAGLRGLQEEARLRAILHAVAAVPSRPPVFVKVAPDLRRARWRHRGGRGRRRDGLIVSNTTVARPPGLRGRTRRRPAACPGRR